VSSSILRVPGLSPTQVNAIGYGSEYSDLADNYSLRPDDVYREATLKSLERKGYVTRPSKVVGAPWWLTGEGLKVKRDFDRAHQDRRPEMYHPE
jgi:hypothetical protein